MEYIESALLPLERPGDLYARADDAQRRLLNQAIFEKVLVDEDEVTDVILKEPFATLSEIHRSQPVPRSNNKRATSKGDSLVLQSPGNYLVNSSSSTDLVGLLGRYWNRGEDAAKLRELLKISSQPLREPTAAPSPRRSRQLRDQERARLLEDYASGMLVREIAARYGIHRITVTNLVNASGQPLRMRGLTKSAVREAVRLYDEGSSLATLAKRYDVTAETVRQHLLKAGVKMRPRPGWTA